MPAIIWRCNTGEGSIFAVNGDYMEGKSTLGILDAMVYESQNYALYNVVNAQNLSLTGFPDLTKENEKKFTEVYGFDSKQFCQNIVWPALISVAQDGDWKIISMHNSIPELKQNKDEVFPREWILEAENLANIEIYLLGKFKRGFFKTKDINYITYSSVTRRSTFFLRNSSSFEIKRNFSEVEERLETIKSFYKLDRGTIVNIEAVEILDLKEERIIFKNKQTLYVSKVKLKELESKWISIKNKKNIEF